VIWGGATFKIVKGGGGKGGRKRGGSRGLWIVVGWKAQVRLAVIAGSVEERGGGRGDGGWVRGVRRGREDEHEGFDVGVIAVKKEGGVEKERETWWKGWEVGGGGV